MGRTWMVWGWDVSEDFYLIWATNSTTLRTSRLLFFLSLGMLFQPDCPTEVIERNYIVSINLTWMTRLCKLLDPIIPSINFRPWWQPPSQRLGVPQWQKRFEVVEETMILISQFYQYMNSIHSIALSFTKSSQQKKRRLGWHFSS